MPGHRPRHEATVTSPPRGEASARDEAADRLFRREKARLIANWRLTGYEDRATYGEKLQAVQTYNPDGTPTQRRPRAVIDGQPLAVEGEMDVVGLRNMRMLAVVRGEYPPARGTQPEDPQNARLKALNTLYIFKGPDPEGRHLPHVTFITNRHTLEQRAMLLAEGRRDVPIPEDRYRIIRPGDEPLQLGRGDDAWWPYDHRGEGYPGEPRVSRHQATVTMELTGPIIVADGDGEGHMSWNGTRIAQGMATPDSEPRPAAERPPAPFVGHTAVEYAGVSHGHTQLDDGTTQGHVPHDFIMRQPPDIE